MDRDLELCEHMEWPWVRVSGSLKQRVQEEAGLREGRLVV